MLKKIILFCAILLTLATFQNSYALDENYSLDKKNVLIINSYNKGLKWTDDIVLGIESVLGDKANIYVEDMDTKRIYDEEHYSKLRDLFAYKFKNYSFDVIITSDVNALDFAIRYGKEIFSDTPIVFCGVNNMEIPEVLPDNMTGVMELIDIRKNIDLALSLHKGAKNIFVVADNNETGKNNRDEAEEISREYNDINFQYTTDLSMKEIIERVSKMGEETIILALSYVKDSQGNIFSFQDVARIISTNTNAPFYGTWDFYIGSGIIGGYVASGFYQGEKAGELAERILEGQKPEDIPIIKNSPNKYMFDYEKLKKHNIKESSLPKEAIIVNKPSSFYQENKLIVNITISFLIFLMVIIVFLLINISKRKAIEKDLLIKSNEIKDLNANLENKIAERTEELQLSNDKLKKTLELLRKTQKHLIEREKISALGDLVGGVAHEINTPLGIALTGITFLSESSKKIIHKFETNQLKKSELDDFFKEAVDTVSIILANIERASKTIKSFKQIAIDQHTGEVQTVNLKKYIEDVILSLRPELKKTKISLNLLGQADIKISTFPGDIAHIITNFVMNTLTHAYGEGEEGKIDIKLEKGDSKVIIKYKDYGKGIKDKDLKKIFEPFYTTARNKGGTGLGLYVAYNLVTQRLKGTITCRSQEGEYTEFTIILPNLQNQK